MLNNDKITCKYCNSKMHFEGDELQDDNSLVYHFYCENCETEHDIIHYTDGSVKYEWDKGKSVYN